MPVSPVVLRPRAGEIREDGDINPEDVLLGEPIVGVEKIDYQEGQGFGAFRPKVLKSPREPTPAERARHDVTHIPYEPWCPFCTSCKRGNSHHRSSHEMSRCIPLVVADYAFLRNEADEDLATVLVMMILPYKICFACVVDMKGPDPNVLQRIAQLFKDLGLVHFGCRSDQENSIKALLEQAVILSGRQGKKLEELDVEERKSISVMEEIDEAEEKRYDSGPPQSDRILVAVPGHTTPGESSSNGIAERAIQQVEDQLRTMKAALEGRLKARIPMNHSIMNWMVEHSAHLLTKYLKGPDGRSGFGRLHGKEVTERICKFGERILYYVPRKLRAKMDPRWRYGVFVGRSMHSDQTTSH